MLIVYGIPQCDTVKKTRLWLAQQGHGFTFHDHKKQGVCPERLASWVAQGGWERLVNRQGTTWRQLDAATQSAVVDGPSAIALMVAHPSLIKRPVVEREGRVLFVGFKPEVALAALAG